MYLLRLLLTLLSGISLTIIHAQDASRLKHAVTWRNVTPVTTPLAIGDVITITLEATVPDGFHMYSANQPTDAVLPAAFEGKSLIGLSLIGGLEEEGQREVYHDPIFDADIAQFSGKVIFRQKVKITAPQASLAAILTYQVCDNQMCIPGSFAVNHAFTAVKTKKAKRSR